MSLTQDNSKSECGGDSICISNGESSPVNIAASDHSSDNIDIDNDDDKNNNNNSKSIGVPVAYASDDFNSIGRSDNNNWVAFASDDFNSIGRCDSNSINESSDNDVSSSLTAEKRTGEKEKKISSTSDTNVEIVHAFSIVLGEDGKNGNGNEKKVAALPVLPNNENIAFNSNTMISDNANNGNCSSISSDGNDDACTSRNDNRSIKDNTNYNNNSDQSNFDTTNNYKNNNVNDIISSNNINVNSNMNVNTNIRNSNQNMSDDIYPSNNNDVIVDTKIITDPYPSDTYSILALHGPIENPAYFSFGLMVYLFQISFLLLMVLSVVHRRWSSIGDDNPGADILAQFIPANVSPLVRATQIMATLAYTIFADSTIRDVAVGVELFPRIKKATPDDRVGCMVFSSMLRLSQGILAIIVTLFLIVSTSNVIDIILNFTAINYISALDDIGFEVIKWGKYGTKFKDEAERIEKLPLPKCISRNHKVLRYWSTFIPIGVILMACLCSVIFLQESNEFWVTKIYRVQFQDKEQGLQMYNGCYEKNEDVIGGRKVYEGHINNSESAHFEYCTDERQWILFKGSATNACGARENNTEVARSSRTDTFDVLTMFEKTWYSSSNTPLDVYFIEDNDKLHATCPSFIDDGKCDLVLNAFDYQYDGGDCCAATCSGSSCGNGLFKNAFGTNITMGDGFPNCTDPNMVPITIRLDNIFSSAEPQYAETNEFPDGESKFPDVFDNTSTIVEILANRSLLLPYQIDYFTSETIKPLLFIDCDGSNVLSIYVDKSMEKQTETIMVSDGAVCNMTIRNSTSSSHFFGKDPIWYVQYTILHEDKQSVESNSVVISQSFSAEDKYSYFKRIPNCYLDKLSDYIDKSTVYTAVGSDPSAKAIDWLMNDESENSSCENSFLSERYALAVIYYTNSNHSNSSWISKTRQCVWPSITCENEAVVNLNLGSNNLAASIPSEIGLLTSLHTLHLYNNQLNGSIPSEIQHMTSLRLLNMNNNQLNDSIPSQIGLMTSLAEIYLEDNELAGPIPSEIQNMTSLKILVLYNNQLDGSIPSEIGLLTSIVKIKLHENMLIGTIPSDIGLMTLLTELRLRNNELTGPIPAQIGNLTALNHLNLKFNKLTGPIPSEIGRLTSLKILYLESNELTGPIPSEIGRLTSLKTLYLYGNYLTGAIPSEVQALFASTENSVMPSDGPSLLPSFSPTDRPK
ncbi:hypothetical protein FRACYDRAFT_245926 [Fragilariopsis cylindrus CCMP1102]|uniref:non-specific serine/threonine protein kinase n=1 Tax=Fragilariopsis cylindrus CCMP1102 TaxID=635003 RepID=A0A1E7F000_9STRA|nr:hypothetical protein FRACYDRAFT_245926 [Fragilariopsis cylindrus CCMP1102]|eukprot:OEU11409.1 hypothetical protein FRACYDRAFT_245926 [Fragilariopsis cylindrus CCMP1102]